LQLDFKLALNNFERLIIPVLRNDKNFSEPAIQQKNKKSTTNPMPSAKQFLKLIYNANRHFDISQISSVSVTFVNGKRIKNNT